MSDRPDRPEQGRREQPATEAAARRVAAAADPTLVSSYEGSATTARRARAWVEDARSRRAAAPQAPPGSPADDAPPGLPIRRRR